MLWRLSVRRAWWSALRPRPSFFTREIITYTPLAPTHHPRVRPKAGRGSKEVAQAYALATPSPSHSLFLHSPHASSKPVITSPHARFASRSRSRRSQSPRSMNSRPSVVRSDSRFHSCSCSLEVRKRRAAFVVVCRLMCSVSETFERCWRSSRVERVRWDKETIGSVEECGRDWRVCSISGRSESISSADGIMARGPVKEAVREVRTRDWWVRWVVRESWAVLRLRWVSQGSLKWVEGELYRVAPFSIAIWLPRSRRCSVTRLTTSSEALPFSSIPRLARLSMAAMRASRAGVMPSFSRSESSP